MQKVLFVLFAAIAGLVVWAYLAFGSAYCAVETTASASVPAPAASLALNEYRKHNLLFIPSGTFQPNPPDVTGKNTKDGRNQWLSKFFCETKISDLALVIFTYGLLVATGWLVWATLKMWAAGERQADIAEKSANAALLAAETALRIELPNIVFSPPTVSAEAETEVVNGVAVNGFFEVKATNEGRTAAAIVRQAIGWMIARRLPDVPEYTAHVDLPPGATLPAGQTVSIPPLGYTFRDDEIRALRTLGNHLYVFAEIQFKDFLDKPHAARVCAVARLRLINPAIVEFEVSPDIPAAYLDEYLSKPTIQ